MKKHTRSFLVVSRLRYRLLIVHDVSWETFFDLQSISFWLRLWMFGAPGLAADSSSKWRIETSPPTSGSVFPCQACRLGHPSGWWNKRVSPCEKPPTGIKDNKSISSPPKPIFSNGQDWERVDLRKMIGDFFPVVHQFGTYTILGSCCANSVPLKQIQRLELLN